MILHIHPDQEEELREAALLELHRACILSIQAARDAERERSKSRLETA